MVVEMARSRKDDRRAACLEAGARTADWSDRGDRMKIVVPDDFPPVYEGHSELDALAPYGEVSVHGKRAADQGELAERLLDAGAVINVRAYSRFDEALFSSLPELRALAILGTGTDNVDLQAATRHGVVVSNTPGASTVSVAEHTIALMFA